MRAFSLCLLVLAGGCGGGAGAVSLDASHGDGVMPAVAGFHADAGKATVAGDGTITFTATSPEGTLTVQTGVAVMGAGMLDLAQDHNDLSLDLTGAGWSSNGGTVVIDGVKPYRLRFVAVPMRAGAGAARGTFTLDGSGTFE